MKQREHDVLLLHFVIGILISDATIAMVTGIITGYVTKYVVPFGLPAVQSLFVTGVVYYIAMKVKAKVALDRLTTVHSNENAMELEG